MAKILFVMRATTHFHFYRSIVEALLRRGHEVKILFGRFGERWSEDNYVAPLVEFQNEVGKLDYAKAHERSRLQKIVTYTRTILNYHRNLNIPEQPRYFRDRVVSILPLWLQLVFKSFLGRFILRSKSIGGLMRFLERKIPPDSEILEDIKKIKPDILIAPAGNLNGNSVDVEYLKAADFLNIPTVTPVISWDYLSTKGAIHIIPSLLLCWNRFHKEEALKYHHFPEERIRIIGSPFFDKWFNHLKPALSREAFCAKHGLRPNDSIFTYLGSTPNVALDESWVVADLRKALNNSKEPLLQKTQIILRPHPVHAKIYDKIISPGLTIVPKTAGKMPDTKEALELFYDTIYHSVAVIGINTQAMIDSIAAGRPCLAMIVEKYKARQTKTSHFHHLSDSGAIYMPRSADEALPIMLELIKGNDPLKNKREESITELIRPRGLKISAGEVGAIEIENLLKSK